jgi:hypothetical protein
VEDSADVLFHVKDDIDVSDIDNQSLLYIKPTGLSPIRKIRKELPSNLHEIFFSDHSSYKELVEFIIRLKPIEIIAIVNRNDTRIDDFSYVKKFLRTDSLKDCSKHYRLLLKNINTARALENLLNSSTYNLKLDRIYTSIEPTKFVFKRKRSSEIQHSIEHDSTNSSIQDTLKRFKIIDKTEIPEGISVRYNEKEFSSNMDTLIAHKNYNGINFNSENEVLDISESNISFGLNTCVCEISSSDECGSNTKLEVSLRDGDLIKRDGELANKSITASNSIQDNTLNEENGIIEQAKSSSRIFIEFMRQQIQQDDENSLKNFVDIGVKKLLKML